MTRQLILTASMLVCTACATGPAGQAAAHAPAGPAPDVTTLSGTFAGSWESFGIDREGRVALQVAWVDTIAAVGPIDEPGRIYVNTSDRMTFSGGRIPPQRVAGREGYLRNPDGSYGDYFVETMGQTSRMQQVAPAVWISVAPAAARELAALGPGATGEHVLVKVISMEQHVETHRISRVTTLHWTDGTGTARSAQYVSIKGEHHRLAP